MLTLRRGGAVRGRVDVGPLRPEGLRIVTRPLAGDRNAPFAGVGTVVASDGTFLLPPLSPGPHEVGLFIDSAMPARTSRIHVDERGVHQLDFAADPRATWNIRLQDDAGRPLPKHVIHTEGTPAQLGAASSYSATTDAEGVARLPRRGGAQQDVFVHLPPRSQHLDPPALHVAAVTPSSLTTITLPTALRTSGSVRGRLAPNPLAVDPVSAIVFRRAGGSLLAPLLVGTNEFVADVLPAGTYEVCLRVRHSDEAVLCVLTHLTLQPGEHVDMGTLHAPSWGTAHIGVVTGGAVAPLHVSLHDAGDTWIGNARIAVGDALRRTLIAGRYTARYTDSTGTRVRWPFDVVAGADVRVVLPRSAGTRCRIVVESDTIPQGGGPLLVTLRAGTPGNEGLVTPDLSARAWPLEIDLQPGVYRFAAQSGDGRKVEATLTVSARSDIETFPIQLR